MNTSEFISSQPAGEDPPHSIALEVLDIGFGRLVQAAGTLEAADSEPLVLDRTAAPVEARPPVRPSGLPRIWLAVVLAFAVGMAAGNVAAHSRANLRTAADVSLGNLDVLLTRTSEIDDGDLAAMTFSVPVRNDGNRVVEVVSMAPADWPATHLLPAPRLERVAPGETRIVLARVQLDCRMPEPPETTEIVVNVRTGGGPATLVAAPLYQASDAPAAAWRALCAPVDRLARDEATPRPFHMSASPLASADITGE